MPTQGAAVLSYRVKLVGRARGERLLGWELLGATVHESVRFRAPRLAQADVIYAVRIVSYAASSRSSDWWHTDPEPAVRCARPV